MGRVLIVGPVFSPDELGGLQIVIRDIAAQLASRKWCVETCIDVEESPCDSEGSRDSLRDTQVRSGLSMVSRWNALFRLWHRLSPGLRHAISTPFKPRAYFDRVSDNLNAIESRLADLPEEDLVLYFVDEAAPGMTALVTSMHRRVLVTSLGGLASEFGAGWWRLVRMICRVRFGAQFHPFLFQRARPSQVDLAVFGSRAWMEQAVAAGLARTRAQTLYFGIPLPRPLPRPHPFRARILWVGRLVPSKGLHLMLQALSAIRESVHEVSLTAVAGQGQTEYRQNILEMIQRYGLGDCVTLAPPLARDELQAVYAEHDVLFFYSQYSDPVALVLMEAFAAGLPVISSQPGAAGALVKDDRTCLCYDPCNADSVIDTSIRLLQNAALRGRLAEEARKLVEEAFSLDAMGRAYDKLLREQWAAPEDV